MAEDMGVKLGVAGENEFKKAIRDINAQFKELSSEMNLATSAFDKNDSSVEALSAQNQVLNKQIDAQVQKIETLKKALENAASSFGENDKRTKAWQTQLNNAKAELNGMRRTLDTNNKKIDDTGDSFNDAEKDVKQFASETEKAADKTEKSGSKFEGMGKILAGIGVAITSAVTAVGAGVNAAVKKIDSCVDVYSSFDDSMRQVAATMGMSSDEISKSGGEFEMLEKAAEKAGSTTRFSASQAADALNYLALAGYDAEKAAATLPKVLDLAAAGNMDLATTSDLVTDSMSALGLETKELDTFMDQMAKASQKSNTSVQQLGEATLVCAGAVSGAHQSLNTMNTELGVLADSGIKGAEGGTKLRNVILSLSAPTDKAADCLNSLGVSVYDSKGTMRDLNDIMTDLNNKLGDMSQEAKNNALNTIFNKADLGAVDALLRSTTGRFHELSGLIDDSKGAAKEMANTMESGLAGAERSFGSALEGVQIQVGKIFEGLKSDALGSVTQIMNDLSNALSEANGNWSKIGDAVGGAISGIVSMVSSYLPKITNMGIKVITALLKGISENKDSLANTAKDLVDKLSAAFVEFLPQFAESAGGIISAIIGGIMNNLSAITDAALQVITTIANGIGEGLPNIIPTIVDVVMQIVDTLLDHIDELVDAGVEIIEGLIDGITEAIPKIVKKIPEIIKKIVSALDKALPKILKCGVEILEELIKGITKALPELTKELPKIIKNIVDFIMKSLPQIIKAGVELFSALVDNMPAILKAICEMLPELVKGIATGITDNLDDIIDAGVTLLSALIDNIPAIVTAICDALPELITGITSGLLDPENLKKMLQAGIDLFCGIVSDVPKIVAAVVKSVPKIVEGITESFGTLLGKMFGLGEDAAKEFGEGFSSTINAFLPWGNDLKISDDLFKDMIDSGMLNDEQIKEANKKISEAADDTAADIKAASDVTSYRSYQNAGGASPMNNNKKLDEISTTTNIFLDGKLWQSVSGSVKNGAAAAFHCNGKRR